MPCHEFEDLLQAWMQERFAKRAVHQRFCARKQSPIRFERAIIDDRVGISALEFLHPVPGTVDTRRLDVALAEEIDAERRWQRRQNGRPTQQLALASCAVLLDEHCPRVPLLVVVELEQADPDAQVARVRRAVSYTHLRAHETPEHL